MEVQVRAFLRSGLTTNLSAKLSGRNIHRNDEICYTLPKLIQEEVLRVFSIPYGDCLYAVKTVNKWYIVETTRVVVVDMTTEQILFEEAIDSPRYHIPSGDLRSAGETCQYFRDEDFLCVALTDHLTIGCLWPKSNSLPSSIQLIKDKQGEWQLKVNGRLEITYRRGLDMSLGAIHFLGFAVECRLNDAYGYELTPNGLNLIRCNKHQIYLSLRKEWRATENFTLFDADLRPTSLNYFRLVNATSPRLILPTGYGSLISINTDMEAGTIYIPTENSIETAHIAIPETCKLLANSPQKVMIIENMYSPLLKRGVRG